MPQLSAVGRLMGAGRGVPANALTFNGVPLTFNGQYLVFTRSN